MQDTMVRSFMIGGQPWTGTVVAIRGERKQPGESITLREGVPVYNLVLAINKLSVAGLAIDQNPEELDGIVTLRIGPHP